MTLYLTHIGVASLGLVTGAARSAPPPDPVCTESLFSVAAQIQAVLPANTAVTIHQRDGSERAGRRWSCIRYGEVLTLPQSADMVYLFTKGATVALPRGAPPYRPTGPIGSAVSEAERYLVNLFSGAEAWSVPTSSRGSEGGDDHRELVPVTVLLEAAATQKIVPELTSGRVFLATEHGTAPRRCLGIETGAALAVRGAAVCDLPVASKPGRASMTDGRGVEIGFRLTYVDPASVPRPVWLGHAAAEVTPEERTAWGAWLIDDKSVTSEWKLLGLSMIAAQRCTVWAAAALLRNLNIVE